MAHQSEIKRSLITDNIIVYVKSLEESTKHAPKTNEFIKIARIKINTKNSAVYFNE